MPDIDIPNLKATIPNKEPVIHDTKPSYHDSIVTSKHNPLASMLMYLEGQTVTVNYYSQYLGKSEELATPDFDQEVIYQSYRKINGMELKFDGQLSTVADTENQELTITGSAKLYPYLRPNKGDVFAMDIGEGKAGRFTVTEVEQFSLQNETAFGINFQLAREITEADFQMIERKVIEEYYFVKDFMRHGQNPLLFKSDYVKLNTANQFYKYELDDYIGEFMSNQHGSLMVPGTNAAATYDPWVVKAFLSVMDARDHRRVINIREYNVEEIAHYYNTCIWAAIIDPNRMNYRRTWLKARPENVNRMHIEPYMNSILYSQFTNVIVPLPTSNTVDDYSGYNRRPVSGYSTLGTGAGAYTGGGATNAIDADGKRTNLCYRKNYYSNHHLQIHPWDPRNHLAHIENWQCYQAEEECTENDCEDNTINDGYFLPPNFFDTPVYKDAFLSIVKGHLHGDAIDPLRIINLLEQKHMWRPMDRFYKCLALLIILKMAIRRM